MRFVLAVLISLPLAPSAQAETRARARDLAVGAEIFMNITTAAR